MATGVQVVFDCASPSRVAEFWRDALGYQLQPPPAGFESWEAFLTDAGVPESEWDSASAVIDPAGAGPRLFFQRVPEPKAGKNRVHLDISASKGPSVTPDLEERKAMVRAEVTRLIGIGATEVRDGEELGGFWVVMRDVEDNEFCVH